MTHHMMNRRWMGRRVQLRVIALLGLFLTGLLYWLLAWYVQRVDFTYNLPTRWETLTESYPRLVNFSGVVAFGLELLSPYVLRHMIPLAVGVLLGYWVAQRLVMQLYELPNRSSARRLLARLRGGASQAIELDRTQLAEQLREHDVLRIGGPGTVIVGEYDAAVTELNGHFARVLPPGRRRLNRFEYIKTVVDLQTHERRNDDVTLSTREGFKLHTSVNVVFRLRGTGERTPERTFTVNEDSVRKVAYMETVSENGISRWLNAPMGVVIGQLASETGRQQLDDLIDHYDGGAIMTNPDIQRTVRQKAKQILRGMGIDLVSMDVGALRVDDSLHETLLEYWKHYSEPEAIPDPPSPGETRERKRKQIRKQMMANLGQGLLQVQERAANNRMMAASQMEMMALMQMYGQGSNLPATADRVDDEFVQVRRRDLEALYQRLKNSVDNQ